tara:strand:+ start:4450 stop:4581 length:132 start_codon:yes stop_codon:yes gene_type:complete
MKKHHHAFENQIFDAFRKREKKIKKYITFLKKNGYTVYEKKEL